MKPQEYISFAGKMAARLAADSPDCATIRSVVSRAYYGAFHTAIEVLRELDCAPLGDSHGNVRDMLSASGHTDAIEAANCLRDMHGDRVKADYKLENTRIETRKFATLNVEAASDFMTNVGALRQACSDTEVKHQIVSAIRTYCTAVKIPLAN